MGGLGEQILAEHWPDVDGENLPGHADETGPAKSAARVRSALARAALRRPGGAAVVIKQFQRS